MKRLWLLPLIAALPLWATGLAQAAGVPKVEAIFTIGDKIGSVQTNVAGDIEVHSFNDNGQVAIVTETVPQSETLLWYSGGKLTPLAYPKGDAPGGKWSELMGVRGPVSMNNRGSMLFTTDIAIGGKVSPGTFYWDGKTQQRSAIALTGMPAVGNLTFTSGGGDIGTAINDNDEIAFAAFVANAAGKSRPGIFFRGTDARLQAVMLPDQTLPDGGKAAFAFATSMNDAGVIAFIARHEGDKGSSAYLSEKGVITSIAAAGMDLPGGGKLGDIWRLWVNNRNRNVLIAARPDGGEQPTRLYLYADGKLKLVLGPGQELPGGGKLKRLQGDIPGILSAGDGVQLGLIFGVSAANGGGQHAILGVLEGNATAAYLMDADGQLSPILRSGDATDLGKISTIGESGSVGGGGTDSIGIGLNSQGQVALVVNIPGRHPTLVLVTPVSP